MVKTGLKEEMGEISEIGLCLIAQNELIPATKSKIVEISVCFPKAAVVEGIPLLKRLRLLQEII